MSDRHYHYNEEEYELNYTDVNQLKFSSSLYHDLLSNEPFYAEFYSVYDERVEKVAFHIEGENGKKCFTYIDRDTFCDMLFEALKTRTFVDNMELIKKSKQTLVNYIYDTFLEDIEGKCEARFYVDGVEAGRAFDVEIRKYSIKFTNAFIEEEKMTKECEVVFYFKGRKYQFKSNQFQLQRGLTDMITFDYKGEITCSEQDIDVNPLEVTSDNAEEIRKQIYRDINLYSYQEEHEDYFDFD